MLAEPQPCSRVEQNHFLRWIWEAGRAQQGSLSCWFAPCLTLPTVLVFCKAQSCSVCTTPFCIPQADEGRSVTFGQQARQPWAADVQSPGHGLTALHTHAYGGLWEPLWKESGAAHRGCQGVPGSAMTQGVSRKECCSRTGLGIAAGAVEHGKPEYLPELGARETARWKRPRQLCMTLGKPSVALAGRRKQAGKFKHFPCRVGLQLNFPQVLLQVHGQRRHKVAQILSAVSIHEVASTSVIP